MPKQPAPPAETSQTTQPEIQPVIRPRQVSSNPTLSQQRMEATSGTVFPHLLGMNLNPQDAPGMHGLSWNLGLRKPRMTGFGVVTDYLDQHDMQSLADVYLQVIHPVYSILNPDELSDKIAYCWSAESGLHNYDEYDAVLACVAALGSLYSGGASHPTEAMLVQFAKDLLDRILMVKKPSLSHATAWVLLTLYLRSTSSPHVSWMASCTAMHVLEATGAHQDPPSGSLVYSDTRDPASDDEARRRLFWVAITLNTWIANEYGRSPVVIRGVSCQIPPPRPGDLTADLIHMYRLSQELDPDRDNGPADLIDCLGRVQALDLGHYALKLSQTNLILTIYRRLRATSSSIPNGVLLEIVGAAMTGLNAAIRLAETRCPWWHVANVPFQTVCTLLAIDTRESLSRVDEAMRALQRVADNFPTPTIQQAVDVAKSLVRLTRRKKELDLDALNSGPPDGNATPSWQPSMDEVDDVEADIDWDAFLNADPLAVDRFWQYPPQ